MKKFKICILGGSGFIGLHLANRLSNLGHQVTVLTRHPQRHRDLVTGMGIKLSGWEPFNVGKLQTQFSDMDCIINLTGILNEAGKSTYKAVHVELPRTIVKAMREAGVKRLLHMSALNANVNETHSLYLKTKGEGEDLVHQAPGLAVTSFRPSAVFGLRDRFFNRFATMLRLSPLAFPLACAQSRFAPVYVGDVVCAFERAMNDGQTIGQRLELCGPEAYTLQQLVEFTATQIGLKTMVTGIPDFAARLQARMLALVPGKPFTIDNYHSLQKDSVCSKSALLAMGIVPRSIEAIVPEYLGTAKSRAQYYRYREQARRS